MSMCMYVRIRRVSEKIMRADFLLFYCNRAAWPLLPSCRLSALCLDTDNTSAHAVLFIWLHHHMRRHIVRHNVTPHGYTP